MSDWVRKLVVNDMRGHTDTKVVIIYLEVFTVGEKVRHVWSTINGMFISGTPPFRFRTSSRRPLRYFGTKGTYSTVQIRFPTEWRILGGHEHVQ